MPSFHRILFLLSVICAQSFAVDDYEYGSNEEKDKQEPCDVSRCLRPNCSCFTTKTPDGIDLTKVPQFVILTFDDAINVVNAKTYRRILGTRKNKGNGCAIAMTFFVCHEYNDYEITNELYRKGNEIGVHSITHESDTDLWKFGTSKRWTDEMVGMREILSMFGQIPKSAVLGHRAPFLQTAGNVTFRMLADNNFLYDTSMPTRSYMKPPIWPYTLDYGYSQDCQIRPCPTETYPGVWVVPMVQFKREVKTAGVKSTFHCSMADACTPYPTTANETKQYLIENFERHFTTNKAPFPVFLHEAWLKDKHRLQGYLDFIDDILQKDNVFVVTIQEVLNYMKKPVELSEYSRRKCFSESRANAGDCSEPKTCNYQRKNRFMKSCTDCSKRYPWLENTSGRILKKEA